MTFNPSITKINYYIPKVNFSTSKLFKSKSKDVVNNIISKTGIDKKFKAKNNQYASDLGIEAVKKLVFENDLKISEIDFVIFCNQTPNHILPMSSSIIQKEIFKNKNDIGFIDISQGCSGYIYSLNLARSLILSKKFKKILLITADTYSKIIGKNDTSTLAIFGDGASASIVENVKTNNKNIYDFNLGCDGSKMTDLYLPNSALQHSKNANGSQEYSELIMNGVNIFSFTLRKVPESIYNCLKKNNLKITDIDYFVFHQANRYILETLRDKLKIEKKKFIIDLQYGNTTSSTIPITLFNLIRENKIKENDKILLCGFGVGLSWGTTIIKCAEELIKSIRNARKD